MPTRGLRVRGRHGPPVYSLYLRHDGQPKGVVRDNGGHAVALMWSMKHIYNIDPGKYTGPPPTWDGLWATRTLSYAPLLKGATTIVFEGKPVGTPDPGSSGVSYPSTT